MLSQLKGFGAVSVSELGSVGGFGSTVQSILLRSLVIAPALYVTGSRKHRLVFQSLLASMFVEAYNIGRQTRRKATSPSTKPVTSGDVPQMPPADVRYI